MLSKAILFLLMLIFSFGLFLINNIYIVIGLFLLSIIVSLILKVRLPIYKSFVIIIFINYFMNYLLSDINNALLVTLRLITMFIVFNIVIKKIGINNIGNIIGKLTRSKEIALIITISLSFIPIMIKEIVDIRKSLISKNFPLSFKNILTRPNVFVLTFFNNLFKRINDMEKSFIAKGVEE